MSKTKQQPEKELKASRTDLHHVPFSLLRLKEDGKFNIRVDYGDLEELAASILENGVRNAMRGSKAKEDGVDVFYITDGHRRFKAMQLLHSRGHKDIVAPFRLEEKHTSDEQRTIDMFVTNEGKALTPLEQSIGIHRLHVVFGYKISDLAKKLSKSEVYIGKLLKLHSLPEKAKQLITSGKITATQMMDLQQKGEVEQFMADYEAGKFNIPQTDVFVGSTEPEKITKKQIAKKTKYEYNANENDYRNPDYLLGQLADIKLLQAIADGSLNIRKIAKGYLKLKESEATGKSGQE